MQENIKNKKTIFITSIVISLVIISSIIGAIIVMNYNNNILKSDTQIVIKQYPVIDFNIDYSKGYKIIDQFDFDETTKKEIILGEKTGNYNILVVENGIAKIVEANCMHHICMGQIISKKDNLLKNTMIECRSHGYIIQIIKKEA